MVVAVVGECEVMEVDALVEYTAPRHHTIAYIPSNTARELINPAIELENACNESWFTRNSPH